LPPKESQERFNCHDKDPFHMFCKKNNILGNPPHDGALRRVNAPSEQAHMSQHAQRGNGWTII
jgi:hypothetical protein